jgi:DNA-binding CsgD family transcriptional regulator/PAS domain-containing protein
MDDRALHEAISQLYGAVTAPQEWQCALEGVTNLLHADHANILDRGSPDRYRLVTGVRMDPRIVAQFCHPDAKRHGDPFLRHLPKGVAISRADAVADGDWETTWLYNEIVKAANGFQSAHARLDGTGEAEAVVSFCRARQAGPFDRIEMATFQIMVPHLVNTLDLVRRLHTVQQQNQSLEALLDQVDSGVVLVDAAGRICFANNLAMRILSEADGLTAGPSGLSATTPAATHRLRQAIAAMGPQDGERGASRAIRQLLRLRLTRPSLRPPLLLSLYPVWRLDAAVVTKPRPRVGIFIVEPDSCAPIDRDALADAFRLTPREAAVAELLASGRDLKSIAQTLAIRVGTARNHLKHVLEKTDTHSQAQLMAALRGFVGPRR